MLVLTLKRGRQIDITLEDGRRIEIYGLDGFMRLGIDAPRSIVVDRHEITERKEHEADGNVA